MNSLEERRRFAWYLRHGLGMTLEQIAEIVNRHRETVRQDLRIIEHRIRVCWRAPAAIPRSGMPAWWRRLHAEGAFYGSRGSWFPEEVFPPLTLRMGEELRKQ